MPNLLDPNSVGGSFALQTARPLEWLFVAGALALLVLGVVLVRRRGVEKATGVPAWAGAGVLLGLWALSVAFLGFVWDVAWHADTGRDKELFTVPHTLIVLGLAGLAEAALVSIVLATRDGAAVGLRFGRWRVPRSALALLLMGVGALIGFPLDDYWHATYGIDVTMWSPTHLLMIGGASLTPLAFWLMLAEGDDGRGRVSRWLWLPMAGIVLVGLSTFQLEYDMGVVQWQMLYDPALIAVAAGLGLVLARAAIGRGGALLAVLVFLVLRVVIALVVGVALHHTLPRFPLYLTEALAVEAAFLLGGRLRPLARAGLAGLLVGTVGLAGEWIWTQALYPYPWTPALLPYLWIAIALAVAGAVVGLGAGDVLAFRRPRVSAAAVVPALLVIAALLALHLPLRHADPGQVTVSASAVGRTVPVKDRNGLMTLRRDLDTRVTVAPASSVGGTDVFTVVAWQGGPPVERIPLVRTSPGSYHAARPVPSGGNWKSLVLLERGDSVEAVPISMPADPVYGLPPVDPGQGRTEAWAPASKYLMREFRSGVPWPAYFATSVFALMLAAWTASLGLAYRAGGRAAPGTDGEREQLIGRRARRRRALS